MISAPREPTPIRRMRRRPGTILLIALICLFVALLMATSFVNKVLSAHRQLLTNQRHSQAFWLAEAGAQRALAQLQKSADYSGELWEIDGDELAGRGAAAVNIGVKRTGGNVPRWRITVEARFPNDSDHQTTHRKEMQVPISAQETQNENRSS